MTNILDMMNEIGETGLLKNHPVANYDHEEKMNYLDGLALLMNVDNEIHKKEKDYLKDLISAANLGSEKLEILINFAKNSDKRRVQEIFSELAKKEDIKKAFIIDALVLAEKDGKIHENEKAFIAMLFKTFDFTNKEESVLRDIAKAYKQHFDLLWEIAKK